MAGNGLFGLGKQIDFPENQRHTRAFEYGFVLFCIGCIVLAVIISKATEWGVTERLP